MVENSNGSGKERVDRGELRTSGQDLMVEELMTVTSLLGRGIKKGTSVSLKKGERKISPKRLANVGSHILRWSSAPTAKDASRGKKKKNKVL